VVPTFDVVRVEPTGDTVVAGLADPNAKVEVLDGAAAIASAEANERGEWALALDNALTPGTHDLAIRTTSKDKTVSMLSDQRVAVSVPEKGSKDVLVVLNSPDTPSRVLQMDSTKPAEGPQVATAEPPASAPAPAGSQEKPPAEGPQIAATEAPASGAEKPAVAEEPKPDATVSASPAPASEPSAATAPPAATGPQVAATEAQPEEPAKAEPQVAEKTAEPTPPVVVEKPAAPAEPPPAAVAEKPGEPSKPVEPPKPVPVVTVAAVEADTAGMLYVSGTASGEGKVRVYLDDQAVGEAEPSPTGVWLVEVHREVPPGTYKVRADQLGDSAGDVQARAEVNFEREVEVASLKASGSAGSSSGADTSGKMPDVQTVMIKRGDNLWRIARAAWGKGIRWSTVYQANKDQIRDPHWIYPGQVLVMPTSPEVAKD
jgi:nucleoid-associated protein YgaU